MYESPITIIFDKGITKLGKDLDDYIYSRVQSEIAIYVDRDEMIAALQYDRRQYEKGYADGKAAPVEPAQWNGFGYFKCSNCGGEAPDDGWWKSPFCPHCGKPMENAKEERA